MLRYILLGLVCFNLSLSSLGQSKTEQLFLAVDSLQFDRIKSIIESGVSINSTDGYGSTPLLHMVYRGSIEGAQLVLDLGADVNRPASNTQTPLMAAMGVKNKEMFSFLLKKGANINYQPPNMGMTLLQSAMALVFTDAPSALDWVNFLIDNGANVNARHETLGSTLQMAFNYQNEDLINTLLKRGADYNAEDPFYGTLLHNAVYSRKMSIAETLLNQGMDPNVKNKTGQTPLMHAIEWGLPGFCQLLIEHGADLKAIDNSGKTIDQYAEDCISEEVKNLIKNPSLATSADAMKSKHNDRLVSAIQLGNVNEFQKALEAGAEPDWQHPTLQWTPLHWAVQLGRTEMAKTLIEKGADVTKRDHEDGTALSICAGTGNVELAEIFVKRGADVNQQNQDGVTPLMLAMLRGHKDMCRFLYKNGADLTIKDKEGHNAREFVTHQVMGYDLSMIAWYDNPEEFVDSEIWLMKNVFLKDLKINPDFRDRAKKHLANKATIIGKANSEIERFQQISIMCDLYYFINEFDEELKFLEAQQKKRPNDLGIKTLILHHHVYFGQMQSAQAIAKEIESGEFSADPVIELLSKGALVHYHANLGEKNKINDLLPKSLLKQFTAESNSLGWHRVYGSMIRDVRKFLLFTGEREMIEEIRLWSMNKSTPDDLWVIKNCLPYYFAESLYLSNTDVIEGEHSHEYDIGFIFLALGHYLKVLDIHHPEVLEMMANMGVSLRDRGEFAAVDLLYTELEERYTQVFGPGNPRYARVLREHSVLLKKLGNYEKAKSMLSESVELFSTQFGESHPEYASALRQIGVYERLLKDYDGAEATLKKTINVLERTVGTNNSEAMQTILELGLVKFLLGDLDEAEALVNRAESIYKSLYSNAFFGNDEITGNKGRINQARGNHRTAQQNYAMAKGRAHMQADFTNYRRYALLLSKSYYSQGQLDLAANEASEVLANHQLLVKNTFPTLSEKEKELYYRGMYNEVKYIKGILMKAQPKKSAYADTLYNATLSLKALILSAQIAIRERISTSTDQDLKYDFNSWLKLRDEIARIKPLIKDGDKLSQKLDSLEEASHKLEKKIALKALEFKEAYENKDPQWQEIQATLKPGEAAIEIIRGEIDSETIYGALILTSKTKDHPILVQLENGHHLEKRNIKYYHNAVKNNIEDKISFDAYWKLIHKKLNGISKVYFSPDGVFNQINVNTLKDPSSGKHVIDFYEIVQLTTTRELLQTKKKKVLLKNAVMFGRPTYELTGDKEESILDETLEKYEIERFRGYLRGTEFDDLPGTEGELKAIASILNKNGVQIESYLKADAQEGQLKGIQSPPIVHLATHGFFISEKEKRDEDTTLALKLVGEEFITSSGTDPMLRSGILLAGVSNFLKSGKLIDHEDGILTAFEALKLDLSGTELVVLSACETGLGELRDGQGVYGLQRSLKVAGASSIMMSLWKVSDEATMELMTKFYSEWMSSGNKREAFRTAQISLRETHPDPRYWGAFVLVGD